jgi:hypothetical protein
MKNLTLRSALTFATALVFAAFMWGCDESAQNPAAPSQTQAGTPAGSGSLVTALHENPKKPCTGHHANDEGCPGGGGDPPDGEPPPLDYSYGSPSGTDLIFQEDRVETFLGGQGGTIQFVLGDCCMPRITNLTFGLAVLNELNDQGSCFSAAPLKFTGAMRELKNNPGVIELDLYIVAPNIAGTQLREHRFQATGLLGSRAFPPATPAPSQMSTETYAFTSFSMTAQGNAASSCTGSGADVDVQVILDVFNPSLP